jgi:hypothetical protein
MASIPQLGFDQVPVPADVARAMNQCVGGHLQRPTQR